MSNLPDLFKNFSALAALRPAAIQQFALQQHQLLPQLQPAAEPQLLQKLYEYLEKATLQEAIDKCTDRQQGVKQQRRRQLAAHHAVFDLLLGSLTTYRCNAQLPGRATPVTSIGRVVLAAYVRSYPPFGGRLCVR